MAEYSKLQSPSEIESLFEQSHQKPVLLFKHSLTCPISGAALREYQHFLEARPEEDEAVYTLVELQNAREVSSTITDRAGIKHESPQALLLRDGKVAWHANHWSIKADALAAAVAG